MSEIGGYIEFECYKYSLLHEGKNFLLLNSGRSCLAHLIISRKISHISIPYFLCETVRETCEKCGIDVSYYHINPDFTPILSFEKEGSCATNDFIYIVNFYGQLKNSKIQELAEIFDNKVIIDNAQAFFDDPVDEIDTLYTCRKFFGVADGGILYTKSKVAHEMYEGLELDKSADKMGFLLGRFEGKASDFYKAYVANNEKFKTEPIKRMSSLTENLLRGINYDFVRDRRTENYRHLHKRLGHINKLKVKEISGAFAYPFLICNGAQIRKKLIEKKIYIPTLWPNVLEDVEKDSLEYRYTEDLLPLPCDQRYGNEEMDIIADEIIGLI